MTGVSEATLNYWLAYFTAAAGRFDDAHRLLAESRLVLDGFNYNNFTAVNGLVRTGSRRSSAATARVPRTTS